MSAKAADAGNIPIPTSGLSFVPSTEDDTPRDDTFANRVQEMRAAMERGEDPLAVGAAAQAKARGEELDTGEGEGGGDGGEAEPAGGEAEPVGGEAEPEPEPEGEEPKPEGEEPEAEPEPEPIVVALPGRHPEDPAFEIEVADEETAERLRQAINDGMRRQEFNKQMAALNDQRAELDYIGGALEADPVSFMAERVKPDLRLAVARHIIANATAEEFTELAEAFHTWEDDPRERELQALKLENDRRTKRDQEKEDRTKRAEKEAAISALVTAVENLIPDSFTKREGDRFYSVAARELNEYKRINRLPALDPEQVPKILKEAGILKMFGITETDSRTAAPPAAGPKRPAVAAADPKAKAKAGAERMQNRAAVRRASSAVAPTGTGAAPQRVTPPKGHTVQQRIDWLKEHPEAAAAQ
jgi:hypothetical protein